MLIENRGMCEPFRAWDRLEPRPRTKDFDRALQAEVYDALWFLARQWQFGEFKGDDSGSAVLAKLAVTSIPLSHVKTKEGEFESFDPFIPLETQVERFDHLFDYQTRLHCGRVWFTFAKNAIKNAGLSLSNAELSSLKNACVLTFGFTKITPADADEPMLCIEKARVVSKKETDQFVAAASGRGIDGVALYNALDIKDTLLKLPDSIESSIDAVYRDPLRSAAISYRNWFEKQYGAPNSVSNNTWNEQRLEYGFSCAAQESPTESTVLVAQDYSSGTLDWYSVDIDMAQSVKTTGAAKSQLVTRVTSAIPAQAKFPGQPSNRFWEFEDSSIDISNITAGPTDLAKILLAEYATMYGNDWFIIPVNVAAGCLARVDGLLVTDTFGQKTIIDAAGKNDTDSWVDWVLFSQTIHNSVPSKEDTKAHWLFFPPSTAHTLESEPIEEAMFIRDESANMVWSIETKIHDLCGKGCDGTDAGTNLLSLLTQLDTTITVDDTEAPTSLSYSLATNVGENWIPFLPVQNQDKQYRSIRFQRASMPRYFKNSYLHVRPQTSILRPGFDTSRNIVCTPFVDSNAMVQSRPYYICEEEIPRGGITVCAKYQRTRWYNGKVYTWYGRQKKSAKGIKSGSLRFDMVTKK